MSLFLPSPPELGGSTLNDCKRKFLQQASLLGKALEDARRYCWKVEDNGDNNKAYIYIHIYVYKVINRARKITFGENIVLNDFSVNDPSVSWLG